MKNLVNPLILIVVVIAALFFIYTRSVTTFFEIRNTPEINSAYMRCSIDGRSDRNNKDEPCTLWQTSIIQLIAKPEFFHGKYVEIKGFVRIEFEGNAIYIRQDDYEDRLTHNGLWLSFRPNTSTKECQERYSKVIGRFIADDYGHFGLYSGAIEDVYYCR